ADADGLQVEIEASIDQHAGWGVAGEAAGSRRYCVPDLINMRERRANADEGLNHALRGEAILHDQRETPFGGVGVHRLVRCAISSAAGEGIEFETEVQGQVEL